MKKRTIRIDNIGFRWTTPIVSEIEYPEIVHFYYDKDNKRESCYTLAFWEKSKEGFDLMFCGGRPFELEKDEQEIFWKLAKECHELINSED